MDRVMTDTDPLKNILTVMEPGGIERQEAQGQQRFVMSQTLPRRGTVDPQFGKIGRESFEAVGFQFGDIVDALFVACSFPEGWTKQSTEHSMWSSLVDEQGRVRGSIFYKAAFYDQDAFINLSTRYAAQQDYGDDDTFRCLAVDTATGKTLHSTPAVSRSSDNYFPAQESAMKDITTWLDAQYPDWRNPTSYWNES